MNRVLCLLKLVGSNIKYSLLRGKCSLRGKKIVSYSSTTNAFMDAVQQKGFQCAIIDETTTQLLYEGLLVEQRLRNDYSGPLYSAVAYKLNISFHSLSFNVMNHIASSYLQSYKKLNAAFITPSRRMRYIIKCAPKGILYFFANSYSEAVSHLPTYLSGKKVAILSDHADLIKVQFVRLKSDANNKDRFDYSLLCIDPKEIINSTDRSLYFETIDGLSMKMLNYSFDVLLIHSDIYSLPLMNFVQKINIPCFVVDDSIYEMYNIAKSHKQIGYIKDQDSILYLEDYDKETNPDFDATIYLSKQDIKDHNK